jgi:predicted nicotinamide N-methyase
MNMDPTAQTLSFGHLLGPPIEDAYEETFFLFSESFPSHNLGFVDNKAGAIEIEIAGRTINLQQSPGLLASEREAGTTGAVVWKITPLVGEWLMSKPAILTSSNIFHGESTVVELGCGITGLIGILLAPDVATYVLTDQFYVMKLLQRNITENASSSKTRPKASRAIIKQPRIAPLDWETDKPSLEGLGLMEDAAIDLVIACDCIYNEYLIEPFVASLVDVCRLNKEGKHAAVLVAQQLRSETIFEQFMAAFMTRFDVWRVSDDHLTPELRTGSGYALHLGLLKS